MNVECSIDHFRQGMSWEEAEWKLDSEGVGSWRCEHVGNSPRRSIREAMDGSLCLLLLEDSVSMDL